LKPFPVRKNIRLPRASYQQGHAFFITINTHQNYPWFSKYPELSDYIIQIMRQMAEERKAMLYAWCIMPDHIHLLLQDKDIVEFVRLFKGRMTPKARALEPDRKLWQRSFYDHGLRQEESLEDVALYIWENPVRKGIVDEPTEYGWSGSEVWPNWREHFGRG